jgi:hypothetical protein
MPTEINKWSPLQKTLYQVFLGSPLKLWASVGHWWIWHFDLSKYTEKQKPRVSGTLSSCHDLVQSKYMLTVGFCGSDSWVSRYWWTWPAPHRSRHQELVGHFDIVVVLTNCMGDGCTNCMGDGCTNCMGGCGT